MSFSNDVTTFCNMSCPAPGSLVAKLDEDPAYKPPALSAEVKGKLQEDFRKYSESVQKKAPEGRLKIVNTEVPGVYTMVMQSIMPDSFAAPLPTLDEAKAQQECMLAAQLAYMKMIMGLSQSDHGRSTMELWVAHECEKFDGFDKDKNGTLDASELASCIKEMPHYNIYSPLPVATVDFSSVDYDVLANHFLEAFDVNQDGKISKSEWIVARASYISLFIFQAQYAADNLPFLYEPPMGVPTSAGACLAPRVRKAKVKKARKASKQKKSGGETLVLATIMAIFISGFVAGRLSKWR